MPRPRRNSKPAKPAMPVQAENYEHPDSTVSLRPVVGTQAQFKKNKSAQRYRYDSSLAPALDHGGCQPRDRVVHVRGDDANGGRFG